jgi:hypothetical protein
MPLQLQVENLENVPAEHHALYVEKDGKYALDVADLDSYFDERTSGLRSALQKEREVNGMLKKHVGMTPEGLHAALTNVTSDRIDNLVKQHQQKHAMEIAALQNENKAIRDHEISVIRQTVLDAALVRARATDAGMKLLPEQLGNRFRVDGHDGTRTIVILENDGVTPMVRKSKDGSARAGTFGDLLSEAMQTWPSMFEGTGAGGGGKQSNSGGGMPTSKTITRAEWNQIPPHQHAAKIREGYTVQD